jgi:serine phosphatase RsbU (regulator of sigma subunit)
VVVLAFEGRAKLIDRAVLSAHVTLVPRHGFSNQFCVPMTPDLRLEKAFALRYTDPREALRLAEEVLDDPASSERTRALALLHRYFASFILSLPGTDVKDLFSANEVLSGSDQPDDVVLATTYLANHFESIGQFDRAMAQLAVTFAHLDQATEAVRAQALATAGNVYLKSGDLTRAAELQAETLSLRQRQGDEPGTAASHNQLGRTLAMLGRPDEALAHYATSQAVRTRLNERGSLAWTMLGMGTVYLGVGKGAEALRCFDEGITLLTANDERGRMHLLLARAKALLAGDDHRSALPVLTDAGHLAQRLRAADVQMEALELKSRCHEELEEPVRALDCLKELMHLREDTRKAEQEARLAQVERSMTAEFAVREAKALKAKNEELDFKNRTITESIRYASVIQGAILPTADDLAHLLPGSFLLFRPRDIVSGDFYWAAEVRGAVMVAVGDCTGHGVPGAFMSMIGTDQLNHIIFEQGIDSPALILAEMHERTRRALKQDHPDTRTQDGMELAIMRFSDGGRSVQYAGARRPLIICRFQPDGQYVQEEVKPDRLSIGGQRYTDETQFTDRTIRLQPGDCLYTFSDGIQDQFNAANNAKFSTRRLKETLLGLCAIDPDAQLQRIGAILDDWQGATHQTDDVVLFGFKA